MLTLDEKNRLDQLMGAALLEAAIAERLLHHDVTLVDSFRFSNPLRQWLLQIEASTIQEFAQCLMDNLKAQVHRITTHEDSQVVITPQKVKLAANISLLFVNPHAAPSLQALTLVDEYLTNPYEPNGPLNRKLALQHLLAQVITQEFRQHCAMFGLSAPPEVCSLDNARSHIHLIAQVRSPRLIGWAWLYYHYVCIDLDISPSAFAQMLGVANRTLQRYQQMAFRLLAERLIILESQARLRTHTAALEDSKVCITVLF